MRSRAIHRWNSKTAFTLASFFCLFLFGLFDSLKGSTLSTLLKDLNLNFSLGGMEREWHRFRTWQTAYLNNAPFFPDNMW